MIKNVKEFITRLHNYDIDDLPEYVQINREIWKKDEKSGTYCNYNRKDYLDEWKFLHHMLPSFYDDEWLQKEPVYKVNYTEVDKKFYDLGYLKIRDDSLIDSIDYPKIVYKNYKEDESIWICTDSKGFWKENRESDLHSFSFEEFKLLGEKFKEFGWYIGIDVGE